MASIGAAAFVGYCIYFDHKRRSSPNFKEKLKARRKQADKVGDHTKQLPDYSNQEEVQRFFLQEVQLGEELLAQGDVENGVEHLSMAVAVCGQPHSLLGVLQQSLPQPVYALLLQSLDKAQSRVRSHVASKVPGLSSKPDQAKEGMNEEDVE